MGKNENKKKTKTINGRYLILQSFRSCSNVNIYQGNCICNESWLQVINFYVPTISKAIPNLIPNNFNAAIGTVVGLFNTSNDSGIYWKQFKCEYYYNGLRRGEWFIYIRPESEESPPEPSQASGFEDIYANSFHWYRVERGMLGHAMITTTPLKEKKRKHLPTMAFWTSQMSLIFPIGTINMQPISLDSIMMKQGM